METKYPNLEAAIRKADAMIMEANPSLISYFEKIVINISKNNEWSTRDTLELAKIRLAHDPAINDAIKSGDITLKTKLPADFVRDIGEWQAKLKETLAAEKLARASAETASISLKSETVVPTNPDAAAVQPAEDLEDDELSPEEREQVSRIRAAHSSLAEEKISEPVGFIGFNTWARKPIYQAQAADNGFDMGSYIRWLMDRHGGLKEDRDRPYVRIKNLTKEGAVSNQAADSFCSNANFLKKYIRRMAAGISNGRTVQCGLDEAWLSIAEKMKGYALEIHSTDEFVTNTDGVVALNVGLCIAKMERSLTLLKQAIVKQRRKKGVSETVMAGEWAAQTDECRKLADELFLLVNKLIKK